MTDGPRDHAGVIRRQRGALERLDRDPRRGEFYDLEGFKAGGVRIRPYEIEIDRRRGRQVAPPPPVPFRDRHAVVGPARRAGHRRRPLARRDRARPFARDELGFPDARFVQSNLYDLPAVLEGTFDVVYTSRGVLGWLPDIRAWARVVAHFLAPGGTFFITEVHPVMQAFENEGVEPGELRLTYPYWEHAEPLTFAVKGSYADPTPTSAT